MANRTWPQAMGCMVPIGLSFIGLASWNPYAAFTLAGLAVIFYARHRWKRRLAKIRHPKDFGYSIHAEFGPEGAIPRRERLTEIFPDRPSKELDEWLQDYQEVDSFASSIAEMGGTVVLGREVVIHMIRSRFEWMTGRGSEAALSRISYEAVFNDYHDRPIRSKDFSMLPSDAPFEQFKRQPSLIERSLGLLGKGRGLVGVVALFAGLGVMIDLKGWATDIQQRLLVFCAITLSGIPVWAYLHLFAYVRAKHGTNGRAWTLAMLLLHPISMVVWMIAIIFALSLR